VGIRRALPQSWQCGGSFDPTGATPSRNNFIEGFALVRSAEAYGFVGYGNRNQSSAAVWAAGVMVVTEGE